METTYYKKKKKTKNYEKQTIGLKDLYAICIYVYIK